MDQVLDIIKKWYPIITSIVGTFAVIATMTKNKADNKIVNVLLKVVNWLGANIGKAKNEDK